MGDWRYGWLAGTGQGLFVSEDGRAWDPAGNYPLRVTSVRRMGGRIALSEGSGMWEALEPGRWRQLHDETLTEVLDCAFLPGDPGWVAASAYGVATGNRDARGAVRWSWHSDGLTVNERFANAVSPDPGDPSRWVVGTEAGVLVAEEKGRRWHRTSLTGFAVRAVSRFRDAWWAGSDGHGAWTSPDALTWRPAGRGLDGQTVFALAESPDGMLAGTLDGVAVGSGSGFWHRAGPAVLTASVGACPVRPSFWVAGAAPGGLWVTENAGGSWRQIPGIPTTVEAILPPSGRAL